MLRGLRFGKRTGALEVPHAGIAFSTSAYVETRNPWPSQWWKRTARIVTPREIGP